MRIHRALCLSSLMLLGCSQGRFVCFQNTAHRTEDGGLGWEKLYLPNCRDTLVIKPRVEEASRQARCLPGEVNYDYPAPGLHHLHNRHYAYDPATFSVESFEIIGDSILAAMEYPQTIGQSGFSDGSLYCDLEGCNALQHRGEVKGFCATDTLIALSTEGKFTLPIRKQILLKQRVRFKNKHCDTSFVMARKMVKSSCGTYVTKLLPESDR